MTVEDEDTPVARSPAGVAAAAGGTRNGAAWAALAGVAVLAGLWLLGDVLLPFLLGAAIAYIVDPACRRLAATGMGRGPAVLLILAAGLSGVVALAFVLVPPLVAQAVDLATSAPDALARARMTLRAEAIESGAEHELFQRAIEALRERVSGLGGDALASAWSGGRALFGTLSLLVIAPVVAAYLLLDWERMIAGADGLVPPARRADIRGLARDIDRVLSGFLRGQLTVCLVLGSFYAIALTVVGLDYGLLIGLAAGLLSFVPYVGAMIGAALSLGVATAQFWGAWASIGAVGAIFLAGQLVEGNLLTPRLVGSAVQLHPVWLLFALSAFGAVFGFAGLLVAVPAAAVLGVVTRRAIARYKRSAFYTGARAGAEGADGPEGEDSPR